MGLRLVAVVEMPLPLHLTMVLLGFGRFQEFRHRFAGGRPLQQLLSAERHHGGALLIRTVQIVQLGDGKRNRTLCGGNQLHDLLVRQFRDVQSVDGNQKVAGPQTGQIGRRIVDNARNDARLLTRNGDAESVRTAHDLNGARCHIGRQRIGGGSFLAPSMLAATAADGLCIDWRRLEMKLRYLGR